MRFAELEYANVAIWGCGREGRAVLAALRRRFPDKPLTLAAYQVGPVRTAYIEPVAVGDRFPDMPLFLYGES